MRYKLLGKTGLRVSELCLGAMTFGEEWGWGASKKESKKIFDVYADTGGNFIDTANKYTMGTSEKFCGEFIASDRDHFVLATKYTLSMNEDDPNACGNHRKNLVHSVEASLKRLNTDHIDLLWLHAWDYMTPAQEVMRALDDLVGAGKVLYLGISDTPAWIVAQTNTLADERGLTPFVALQIKYSLLERTVERELMPMAQAFEMAVTPWAVIGGGVLTGKYRKSGDKIEAVDSERIKTRENVPDRDLAIADEVMKIAKERGATPAQVAINWVRQRPDLIIPILGARTEAQIKDCLGCLDFKLNENEMDKLNEISKVPMGFPHEFLESEAIISVLFGNTFKLIDNHRR